MLRKCCVVLFIFFIALAVPFFCSGQKLTIVHANDTHSHLFPFGPMDHYGGMARVSYLIRKARHDNGEVLVLHAGDAFVGTFAFNKYLGYEELKLMESMYDVMCLGNHEFDLGPDNLAAILAGITSGKSPVSLPVLCANIKLPPAHPLRQFVRPHMILNRGGLRIGLIGVVTTDPYHYSAEVNSMLKEPIAAAAKSAEILRARGCEIVICLSHLGKLPDELYLSQVPGIDIIVGGHSHDAIPEPEIVNGKIIVQAGAFNRYLGELNVNFIHGRVELLNYRLYEINEGIRKDFHILGSLGELKNGIESDPRFGQVYSERIATASWNLEEQWETGNPFRDTPLGNLITDAMLDAVNRSGIPLPGNYPVIAIESSGYISHRIYKGKVVGDDILRAVPYGYDPVSGLGSKIAVALLAGAQILAGLEFSTTMVEYTDDLSLQTSGMSFAYDSSKPPVTEEELALGMISRIDPVSVLIKGQHINPEGLYWVVLDELLLKFLTSLDLVPFAEIETEMFLYNVVKDYMKRLKVIKYESDGRIVDTALLPK
ncbi:MAG: 5'-nucleotidase C-terminal domain-containing protein [Candidatus Aminicenantes bacterium]|nr:5'-nucleotidase C-terminal domain-containing protein [Candidatus Aminicenantes bacterium]